MNPSMTAATAIRMPTPTSTQNARSSASAKRPPADHAEMDAERAGNDERGDLEDPVRDHERDEHEQVLL